MVQKSNKKPSYYSDYTITLPLPFQFLQFTYEIYWEGQTEYLLFGPCFNKNSDVFPYGTVIAKINKYFCRPGTKLPAARTLNFFNVPPKHRGSEISLDLLINILEHKFENGDYLLLKKL